MRKAIATINCLALAVVSLSSAATQAQKLPNAVAATEKLPSFEVASIKPSKPDDPNRNWDSWTDRVTIGNYTLRDLIVSAYGLKSTSQVLDGPEWLDKKHFDIAAKVDDAEVARLRAMSQDDRRKEWNRMLQSLLADRFSLKVSHDERTLPVFMLVVAKSGLRLTPSTAKETNFNLSARNSHLTAMAIPMADFADYLTGQAETAGRVVVNRTGLTGNFDFKLDWTRDRGNGIPPDAQYPGLFTALREQLGLRLKPGKAAVDVVVVESAKEPEFD